jgi:glycosyltransferase involved in cell wall biosynthesis
MGMFVLTGWNGALVDKQPALISIITPSFNRGELIRQAIESVVKQDYPCIEHLIIDGGSTDGTLDLLAKYPHLTVVSEPDHGMYDALNKGLRLARGEIIGFLNTDDLYAPGVFLEVAEHFANIAIDAVAGRAEVFHEGEDGKIAAISEIAPSGPDGLLEQVIMGPPGFNAWFFRRSIFERIGGFDTGYRITGDREFMLRLALAETSYARMDRLTYRYRRHTGALTFNWDGAFFTQIVQEHLRLTDIYLRQAKLPERARRLIRKLRTRDTINAVISLIRRHKLDRALPFAIQGIYFDWCWPFKFVSEVFQRLIQIGAKGNSHS